MTLPRFLSPLIPGLCAPISAAQLLSHRDPRGGGLLLRARLCRLRHDQGEEVGR